MLKSWVLTLGWVGVARRHWLALSKLDVVFLFRGHASSVLLFALSQSSAIVGDLSLAQYDLLFCFGGRFAVYWRRRRLGLEKGKDFLLIHRPADKSGLWVSNAVFL